MKSFILIGSIVAASQCTPEPSGGPVADKATTTTGESVASGDAGAAGGDAAATSRGAWLEAGPPPFTVPTQRIDLGELQASMLVPLGAAAMNTKAGFVVTLGEGTNFRMRVSESPSDLVDVQEIVAEELRDAAREDGAQVWEDDGRWYFQVTGALSCWNTGDGRHGRDDVEMMIASCLSAEPGSGRTQ